MDYIAFLGIDLGTSGVKAVLVDEAGNQLGIGSAECFVQQVAPSWQEQDMEGVWRTMVNAVRSLGKIGGLERIRAICFSAAMHGMMAVDEHGTPLTRMMTWADGRANAQAEKLAKEHDGHAIFRRSGCPVTALYYPARILWLKENRPEIFEKTKYFLSIKDAIVHRLTGRWTMDCSHASSNGLLDIRRLSWDHTTIRAAGIDADRLPVLVDSDEIVGELQSDAAEELGLKPGIAIVAGAGDGGLANVGSGAVKPGSAALTVGTSGAMRKIMDAPWTDPDEKIWCYNLLPGSWYAGGAINSGGIILRWLRDFLFSYERDLAAAKGNELYDYILALAATVKPGADGLIFLPYLHGERTPHWNPLARGVMFGLDQHHSKAHVARATIEGICMCIAQVQELLIKSPGGISEIRASGGFSRSIIWLNIMAHILGKAISLPKVSESSAMGAAILAMSAKAAIKDVREAKTIVPVGEVVEPDLALYEFYRERFELFKKLYRHLEPDFLELAGLQKKAEQ